MYVKDDGTKSRLEIMAISGHLAIYHQEGRSPEAELLTADLDPGVSALKTLNKSVHPNQPSALDQVKVSD